MSQWSFDPVGGWLLFAAAALVLAPLAALGPQKVGRGKRTTLAALRGVTLLALLTAMLRPALETIEKRKLPGTLVILADRSRSMQVEDAAANASRWDSVRQSLDGIKGRLAKLAEAWDVRAYTFADGVESALLEAGAVQLPDKPEGSQTAIGAALADVIDRESQQRLVAVLLLSDGAQRAFAPRDEPPQTVVQRMAAAGVPLYAFAYGQPSVGDQPDLRLSDLLVNDAVFAGMPTTVQGVVTATGYTNQSFNVQLLWEDASGAMVPAATTKITIKPKRGGIPIELTHVPTQPGEYKVTLAVESPEGELVAANNLQSTFVTVLKGGVNVLYFAGADRVGGLPGIEPRFVRQALAASPDLHVEYEALNYRSPELDYRARIRDGRYDVFLLGNVDVTAFSTRTWRDMANLVEQGAGLGMLGGLHSFGPGGFRNSPLDDLLPMDIGPAERQNFGEPPRADMHVQGPLKLVPVVRNGAVHPIMRLPEADGGERRWAELPALDGANRIERLQLKPTASVEATSADARLWPLLVTHGWGDGRVASLAVDSTWHWQLGGRGEVHRRFWRQFILWLARKDETEGQRVWVKLDQRRYQPGARVDFTLGAADEKGEPLEGATFDVQAARPDGAVEQVRAIRRGADWGGSFAATAAPGDYRVTVRGRDDAGADLGDAQARFAVIDQDVELDQPAAEPTLLASLANMTADSGGAGLAPEQLPGLVDELFAKSQEFEEETVSRVTLWDTWGLFAALVGGLSTEWFLRKRWGLT
ncbi:MAG: hypothetical protein KF688_08675 [Pirellulales bacterium]|nr:hypothetical protein [Pirellulales bacterium]